MSKAEEIYERYFSDGLIDGDSRPEVKMLADELLEWAAKQCDEESTAASKTLIRRIACEDCAELIRAGKSA